MARVDRNGGLTSDETLVIQAITTGTYFVEHGTPAGDINGVNDTFTLASNPSPDTSLVVFLNGQALTPTVDYTLSGVTITMTTIPEAGSQLWVNYRFSPV